MPARRLRHTHITNGLIWAYTRTARQRCRHEQTVRRTLVAFITFVALVALVAVLALLLVFLVFLATLLLAFAVIVAATAAAAAAAASVAHMSLSVVLPLAMVLACTAQHRLREQGARC